jgi:hypothetical protein
MGRIAVQGQPGEIDHDTLVSKTIKAKWTGDVTQVQSSEFKPKSHQKRKKKPGINENVLKSIRYNNLFLKDDLTLYLEAL